MRGIEQRHTHRRFAHVHFDAFGFRASGPDPVHGRRPHHHRLREGSSMSTPIATVSALIAITLFMVLSLASLGHI
jgi:hypothetical protein